MVDMKKVREQEKILATSTHDLSHKLHEMLSCGETDLAGHLLEGTAKGVILRSPAEAQTVPTSTSVELPDGLHPAMLDNAALSPRGQVAFAYVVFIFGQFPQGVPAKYRQQVRQALETVLEEAKAVQAFVEVLVHTDPSHDPWPAAASVH
ncbi:hypothetical protein [Sinorhizobium fredii]|uniref:hypothetical protein n=1 Tax=Rhizobium fredii TaxID=380 RepID=UPI0013E8C820|nr:hypothetical protein [Sinorhizobium fredii]